MADEGNEDSWLYGNEKDESNDLQQNDEEEVTGNEEGTPPFQEENALDATDNQMMHVGDEIPEEDDGEGEENEKIEDVVEDDDDEDSDDDDHINIVIGDIKSGPSYSIKQRGPIIPQAANAAVADKAKQSAGKFSIEEFESVGTINGVPAHEFSIDSLEDKPWRKPGADITDYFNYGFNEDTWRAYCERQKRMRIHESGVGLTSLTANNPQAAQASNDNSKYGNPSMGGMRRIGGPPPQRRMNGSIDVIGGGNLHSRRDNEGMPNPKENVIQVMTADRREYSRTVVGNKFDSTMPPPQFEQNMGGGGGGQDFYGHPPQDPYGGMYEPTQDSQWMNDNSNWQPSGIKTLTPGPMMPPMGPPGMIPGMMNMIPPDHMQMPPPMNPMGGMGPAGGPGRDRDRDRRDDRERDYRDRDRDRERIRDRDRDRRGGGDRDRRDVDRHVERDRVVIKTEPVDPEPRSSSREESQTKERDREKDRRAKSERSSSSTSSSRKERSRSRERSKSKRRSKSRDRERDRRDKKSSKSSSSSSTAASSSSRKEEKEAASTAD